MIILQVALHALRAEHAAIDRELFPRLESDDLVVFNLELNAALHAAEATMRFHERASGWFVPAARRLVLQVRAVAFDEAVFVECGYGHELSPQTPFPDSAPAAACRHGGQMSW